MSRSYSTAHRSDSHDRPPHSGRVAYCTPCRTHRSCSTVHGPCCSPHLPRDDLVGYCTPFGRVAYWTPFGRAAYCTPFCTLHSCSTVHGSCDSLHVPRDDLVGYCTPFGRVAYCTPFGRVTHGTPFRTHHPCSTVHESCDSPHVHHDDLAGYYTPFHELWSIAPLPPPVGTVYPYINPTMTSPNTVPHLPRSASAAPPPPSFGTVNLYVYSNVNPAPVPTLLPPLDPVVTTERDALPLDERILNDDCSSLTSNSPSSFGLRADFVASLQAAYRTLDMRRVPRVQPLQLPHFRR